MGISFGNNHVLHRMCCRIFYGIPDDAALFGNLSVSANIQEQVSLDSYMDNFLMLIFVMGIVFEMPLVSWLLSKIGLLKRSFFHKYRRHAIVGLLVAAAFITRVVIRSHWVSYSSRCMDCSN